MLLNTIRNMLCADCTTKNARLIEYIEEEMERLLPPAKTHHEPPNPLDIRIREAVEAFMVSNYNDTSWGEAAAK